MSAATAGSVCLSENRLLFRAQAGGSASGPSSTSSPKPQWRCGAESADEVDWAYMMRKLGDEGELFLLFERGRGEL